MCTGLGFVGNIAGSDVSKKIFGSKLGGTIDKVLDFEKYIDPVNYQLGKMFREPKSAPAAPEAPKPPEAPTGGGLLTRATKDADAARKRLALSRGRTILTSPLGVSGAANIGRKTLLGQ